MMLKFNERLFQSYNGKLMSPYQLMLKFNVNEPNNSIKKHIFYLFFIFSNKYFKTIILNNLNEWWKNKWTFDYQAQVRLDWVRLNIKWALQQLTIRFYFVYFFTNCKLPKDFETCQVWITCAVFIRSFLQFTLFGQSHSFNFLSGKQSQIVKDSRINF